MLDDQINKIKKLVEDKFFDQALDYINNNITEEDRNEIILQYLGFIYLNLGDKQKALLYYKKALEINSQNIVTLLAIAKILNLSKQNDESLTFLLKAYKLDPENESVIFPLARLYREVKSYTEAIQYFNKIKSKTFYEYAQLNLAEIYALLNQLPLAISKYEAYLTLNKKNPKAYLTLGNLYKKFKKIPSAIKCFDEACKINPKDYKPYVFIARLMKDKKKAVSLMEKAFSVTDKKDLTVYAEKIVKQSQICDWSFWNDSRTNLNTMIENMEFLDPFTLFPLDINQAVHQEVAKKKWQSVTKNIKPLKLDFKFSNKKIKIGMVSSDFKNHPTMDIIVPLLRYFNKDVFELYLYSTHGRDDKTNQRILAQNLPTEFFDVENYNPLEIAKIIYSHKVDILLDVAAYTTFCRPQIFALKPAPIIINYCAFPGTVGSNVHDYIVSDHNSIPPENIKYFNEKIIFMPNTSYCYDEFIDVYNQDFSKSDFNLPTDKILLCCFNNLYKIQPPEFSIWMNILKKNSNTALVLKISDTHAIENIKKEVKNFGVDLSRIIFLPKQRKDLHLKSYCLMDLFLDTFSYNAHTTAVEALNMGVPLITKQGNNIPSRNASGILISHGLNELIAYSEQEYEEKIQYYIEDKERLIKLKKIVKENKKKYSLFDSRKYVQNMEKVFVTVYQNYKDGKPIDHINIQ